MMILRHVIVTVLLSIFTTIFLLGTIFFVYPLDSWEELFNRTLFDIPFIMLASIVPIIFGVVFGLIIGLNTRQDYRHIEKQLNELTQGQKITSSTTRKEVLKVEKMVIQVQDKLVKQTELSQRLATERTKEREQGLQEVVVQERNRLARELHDSVSQQLFAASMMMSAINEAAPAQDERIKKQLVMVEKMIHQSQLEMRALLLHLRPVALKGKSLQEGAKELLLELQQKVPLHITWKIEQFSVEKGIEDHLFRILQESVSNTLRHAKAESLDVLLIERDELIILRVVDDGIGFNMEEAPTSSYGLQNMKERTVEIGGTCKIISIPGQGTRLEVKIPKVGKEDKAND